mmetsp:Transcript_20396/g.53010  ORF Transcript_20396/g.53010 Transcript_20396/m.53010 type:complete len:364 (+) Transcript_20396:223-1314(+)
MDAARELESENTRRKKESATLLAFLKQAESGEDALRCPVCLTSGRYRQAMVLLVSEKCGHEVCDTCLQRRYDSRATAPCQFATCHLKLRKQDFREKRFVSGKVQLEMAVREELAKIYCTSRVDFADDDAYDRHLEEVEGTVFDLVHGDPEAVAAARVRVDDYRRRNVHVIEARQREAKYARKRKREAIKDEMKATEERRHEHSLQRAKDRAKTRREKDRLKAELLRTTNRDDVKRILEELRALKRRKLEQHRLEAEEHGEADGGAAAAITADDQRGTAAATVAAAVEAEHVYIPLYVYEPVAIPQAVKGPLAPPTPMIAPHLAELPRCVSLDATATPYVEATGHRPKDLAKRAMQDAFSCLFI